MCVCFKNKLNDKWKGIQRARWLYLVLRITFNTGVCVCVCVCVYVCMYVCKYVWMNGWMDTAALNAYDRQLLRSLLQTSYFILNT